MDKTQAFIKHVKRECEAYNVKLVIANAKSVKASDTSRSGGYFMGMAMSGELAVARKREDFLQILVHEFGHLLQWAEGADLWIKAEDAYVKLYEWLDYEKNHSNIQKHLDVCLALELDCEKRAVGLIKKWDLPIDIVNYKKRANAYMYFWKYIKYTRMFAKPGGMLYKKEILDAMPSRFLNKYVLTDKLFDLYVKNGI